MTPSPRLGNYTQGCLFVLAAISAIAASGSVILSLYEPESSLLARALASTCLASVLGMGGLGLVVWRQWRDGRVEQARAGQIIAHAVDSILTFDAKGRVYSFNPAAIKLFGYEPDEILGKPINHLLVDPPSTGANGMSQDGVPLGTVVGLAAGARELQGRRKDGSTFHLEMALSEVEQEDQRLRVAFVRDVTKRKQAQRQLAAYYTATRMLGEAVSISKAMPQLLQIMCDGLDWEVGECWQFDRFTNELRCVASTKNGPPEGDHAPAPRKSDDKNGFSPLGPRPSTDGSLPYLATLTGIDRRVCSASAPVWIPDLTVAEKGCPPSPTPAGTRSACAFPILLGDEVAGMIAFFSTQVHRYEGQQERMLNALARQLGQILKRERAEQELRKSERELADFFQNAPVGIHRVGPEGSIVRVNRAELELLGYSPEEFIGRHVADFHVDPEVVQGLLQRLAHGETVHHLQARLRAKDGSIKHVLIDANAAREQGKFVHARFFLQDVTEQKRLQEQFYQSQKIEAVGQLAGGVAHDFNNLLTVITGYSELLLATMPADPSAREALTQVHKAGKRAASLTRQLLAFSRRQVLSPVVLDLNTRVEELEKMLHRLIKEDIHLTTSLDRSLSHVKADPGQMEQVIVNLVVNARDAMPTGGELTIKTSNVDLDDHYVQTHPYVQPGSYVQLEVSDTGHGMEEATRSRIFEPFFTTKGVGEGTGLGLATVYGIVKQSGGSIEVESELGQGTTFKIYLPACQEALAAGGLTNGHARVRHGNETILLVEDESVVRALAREVFQSHGYKVLEASNGEEALQIIQQAGVPFHLLVTDVVMPRMSGGQLADIVRVQLPETKVLYMSGYTDDTIVRHGIQDHCVAFLQKPFTPDSLVRKVREVLDGREPTQTNPPVLSGATFAQLQSVC